MKISITEENSLRQFAGTALFNLGFRPFFLGAGIYAIVAMLIWWLQYSAIIESVYLTPAWHAHEMIFGYTFAVIAGFLLTSVRNWTGLDTVSGGRLFILFCLWATARLGNTLGSYWLAALSDLSFMLLFGWYAVAPIVIAKQWRQTAIVGIISVLVVANSLYYAGQLEMVDNGIYLGNYLGFYLIVGLVLVMAGRVVPFFIERGVSETVRLPRRSWLEISNLITYGAFVLAIFLGAGYPVSSELVSGLAALLFALNIARLGSWYTHGIWQKPLLWSLFFAYGFITLGFLLFGLLYFGWFSVFIPIHAIAVGGIGLLTLSMMARVSLGHSGRSIHAISPWIVTAFFVLLVAAVARVMVPVLFPQYYLMSIQVSQILWMVSFALFLMVYAPLFLKPRIDDQPG